MIIKNIKKNDEFFDERSGANYRILGKHFNDFRAEISEECDEKSGNFVNYKPCILTAVELKRLLGAQYIVIEE